MAFPYFSPLSPWIIDIMKGRENNPVLSSMKNPFIVMTSGALVVKGTAKDKLEDRKKELINIIKNEDVSSAYQGCIISNNINSLNLSYSKDKTCVGIDFTGKKIEVDGESGRNISTPIIESLDIDTDGANNTLKTARVTVRLFSLKQLEMFELFFMKPGMNVLVEFGDGSLFKIDKNIRLPKYDAYNKSGEKINFTPYSTVDQAFVPKNNYKEFCKNFSEYFRSSTDAFAKYVTNIQKSLGTYDLVAGKVIDFNFSIDTDGTYTATIEISQGNQVSLAIPIKAKKDNSKTQVQNSNPAPPTEEQIKEILAADLNIDLDRFKSLLDSTSHPDGSGGWLKKEFFNFFKINDTNKNTTASDKRYVSMRFILKILMNYSIETDGVDKDFFQFNIPVYKVGGKSTEIIPVTSNKNIISSTEQVIFPTNELPKFVSDKDGKIIIDTKNPIKGTINGYNFHISDKLEEAYNSILIENTNSNDVRVGNALNIFVNYEEVVNLWVKSYTRIQFLEKILELINKNGYGLIGLIFGLVEENAGPSIVDIKFKNTLKEGTTNDSKETYRFKPSTINSIVKEFNFNFEMSTLVAGRTIFNSGKFLAEAKDDSINKLNAAQAEDKLIELPETVIKSIDNSTFANADGYYSINRVELERVLQDVGKKAKKATVTAPENKDDDDEVTNPADDATKIIESKSIKYIMDTSGKNIEILVFKDRELVQNKIKQEQTNTKKPTLSPIDITLTIDGFSGFRCGQYFNIDGIPEIYNQIGIFQITNTKHNIDNNGWVTTLEASHNLTKN